MFEEGKKKFGYGKLCLLGLFACIFVLEFVSSVNASFSSSNIHHFAITDNLEDISRSLRARPPSSYTLKVQSYSGLIRSQAETYLSDIFETGGYSWSLILYPTGNKNEGGANHISLYLAINNTNSLPPNWQVYAEVRFFVYNQRSNQYLTVQDSSLMRFNASKTNLGIAQLLRLETFNNTNNGYLYGDNCQFGVEVFVVKQENPRSETLSFIQMRENFRWRVKYFSYLEKNKFYYSDVFTIGENNWKLRLGPGGDGEGWGKTISLFLELSNPESLRVHEKVYASVKLRVVNRQPSKNFEGPVRKWFDKQYPWWGYQKFLSLQEINDPSKGFLVADTLELEVEFDEVSKTRYFP